MREPVPQLGREPASLCNEDLDPSTHKSAMLCRVSGRVDLKESPRGLAAGVRPVFVNSFTLKRTNLHGEKWFVNNIELTNFSRRMDKKNWLTNGFVR